MRHYSENSKDIMEMQNRQAHSAMRKLTRKINTPTRHFDYADGIRIPGDQRYKQFLVAARHDVQSGVHMIPVRTVMQEAMESKGITTTSTTTIINTEITNKRLVNKTV